MSHKIVEKHTIEAVVDKDDSSQYAESTVDFVVVPKLRFKG